jgi:hypothetical protein
VLESHDGDPNQVNRFNVAGGLSAVEKGREASVLNSCAEYTTLITKKTYFHDDQLGQALAPAQSPLTPECVNRRHVDQLHFKVAHYGTCLS